VNPYIPAAALAYLASAVILLLALPVQLVLLAVTMPFDRNRAIAGRFLRRVAVLMSATFRPWRLEVEGHWPKGGPYVVVANHQSMLDVLLISRLPSEMKWFAKESLFGVPWVGWMFKLAGDIPVRRGDKESSGEVLAKARNYLSHGMSVMIFPEGTRSVTGEMRPFKSGAFRLAVEAGVPVLPLAVLGTAAGLPKGDPWIRPCRGTLRVLEPIIPGGKEPKEAQRLRDAVQGRIAQALRELTAARGATTGEVGPLGSP
jgi:1-acyl-sn-glycerol-3-phosphate acyltransferase